MDTLRPPSETLGTTESRAATTSQLGETVPVAQLLTAARLGELGFSSRGVLALQRNGELVRVRRGVYQEAASWNSLSEDQQQLALVRAFALTSSRPAVFSHFSAAMLHGYSLWGVPPGIHISNVHSAHARRAGTDVVVHKRTVPAAHIAEAGGLSVTTPERTVVDCCRIIGFDKALVIADQALRNGADRTEMNRLAAAAVGMRGVRNVRRVLEFMDGRSESVGESLARACFVGMDLPLPELQFEVHTRLGIFRADFAWPGRMLIVEFDGRTKYFDYGPVKDVLFQERRRERALMEEGWRVIRIEWADLFQPEQLERRLKAALRAEADPFARGA